MRTRCVSMVGVLLLISVGARAQSPTGATSQADVPKGSVVETIPDIRQANFVDFSLRGTSFDGNSDPARFQRYRDLRDGGTVDALRYFKDTDSYAFRAQADHVGYRDQRYYAAYNGFGKVKASFEWNQIPLYFSEDTRVLSADGTLLIPDAIQTGLQNKTVTLPAVAGLAQPLNLRLKRNYADFRFTYSASQNLDLNVTVKNTQKTGLQPWAGTFGFSDAVELAVPIDTRTTELGTALEWANRRGSARLAYDGSFFRNENTTLVWDNPLRITDSPTAGPVQGRESIWPNSNLNSGSASGLLNLPAHTRATAYVSIGNWSQNDPLIPFTINSTLPTIALDRTSADAQARVTAMAYTLNSRPSNVLWLNARFRSYDYDNRTPVFHLTRTVTYDTSVAAFAEGGTSPYSFKRRTFDADASLTPVKYAALRAGYTHEIIDQTFRSFDTTTEDTVRLSADATGVSWLTLRGVYEHGKRAGSGFDEGALDDIGEQVSLRQFDISDRISNRFSAIVQVMPLSALSFSGTVSAGNEDRSGAIFGLRSNDSRGYSLGVDFVPRDAISLGVEYMYEKYSALQASRQANPGPQFDDPTRDWTTDSADKAQTLTASIDLIKTIRKTDVRLAYSLSRADSTYVYGVAPNSTLPAPVQLPQLFNKLQRATADVRYYLTTHLAVGAAYWFDKYDVNDFAFSPDTLTSIAQPSFLMLGYLYRPYTANTVWARLTYLW
jgi:MtrB/PioB family decaheme-associated outer membrane protein